MEQVGSLLEDPVLRLRHDSMDSLDRLRLGAIADQQQMPATSANHYGGSVITGAMPRYPTPMRALMQRSLGAERSGSGTNGGARDYLGPEFIDADTILDMYRYPNRSRQRPELNGSAPSEKYSKSTEELFLPPAAGYRSALLASNVDRSCIGLCRPSRNTYECSQSERFLGTGGGVGGTSSALSPRLVEDALLTRKLLADLDEEIVDKRRTLRRLQAEIDNRRFECDQVIEVHEELARLSSAVEQINLDDLFASTQQQRASAVGGAANSALQMGAAGALPVAPHPIAPHMQTIMTSATTTVNTLVPHGYYLQSASAKYLPQNPSPLVMGGGGGSASLYSANYPPLHQYYGSAAVPPAMPLASQRNDECYSSNDYLVHRRHFPPTAAEQPFYPPGYSYATNGTGATAYQSPRGEQQYASIRAAAGAAAYQQHYGSYNTLPPMGNAAHQVQGLMGQTQGLAVALPGSGLSSPPTSPNYACGYPALPELRSQAGGMLAACGAGGPLSAALGVGIGGGGASAGVGVGGSGLLSASSVAASRDAPLSDPDHERTCLADGCRELDDGLILEHLTRSLSAGGLASGLLAPSSSASLPGAKRGDRQQLLLRTVHVDSAPSVAASIQKKGPNETVSLIAFSKSKKFIAYNNTLHEYRGRGPWLRPHTSGRSNAFFSRGRVRNRV